MKKWLFLSLVATLLFLSAGITQAAAAAATPAATATPSAVTATPPAATATPSAATVTPKLVLDGKLLQSPDPSIVPVLIKSKVLVPVRIVTESLGYEVLYDNQKKQITVSESGKKLVMTVDQPTAYVNDQAVTMDMPPIVISDSAFIPLRFLVSSLNEAIYWDNTSKTVFIYTTEAEQPGSGTGEGASPVEGENPGTGTQNPDNGTQDPGTGAQNPGSGTPSPGTDPSILNPPDGGGWIHSVRYEENAVIVRYTGVVSPNVFVLQGVNPRIVADFPGSGYSLDFFSNFTFDMIANVQGNLPVVGHPALTQVRYSLFAELPETAKAPRFVLDLNRNWNYQVLNDTIAGEVRILLSEPEIVAPPPGTRFTVVLDAGHGGSDPGAPSIDGKREKTFNLSLVLKVRALLQSDSRLNLVLTREGDTYPTLDDRVNLANGLNADLFVSIHTNSNNSASINGTETYYNRPDSKAFAELMHAKIVAAAGLRDRGVKTAGFVVIRETKMPAVLLEIGYLSSKIDNDKLWNDGFQNKVAAAIAAGIKQQLNLA